MSASLIVAANVRRLRKANGWTQMEAATRLAEIGGPTWGNATWSAMERTIDGTRMRSFTADDLVWLSRLFEIPVGDLFEDVPMTPDPEPKQRRRDGFAPASQPTTPRSEAPVIDDSAGMSEEELHALPVSVPLVTAGRALSIGRTKAHELARQDEFPCRVLRIGHTYVVPKADLLRLLGIDPQPRPATGGAP